MKNFSMRYLPLLAVVGLVIAGGASPAWADFRAGGGITFQTGNTFVPIDSYDVQASVEAGHGINFDQNGEAQLASVHVQANSLADVSGLHAHTFVQIIKPFTSSGAQTEGYEAMSNAIGNYSVTIKSASGVPTLVNTRFAVHISGSVTEGAGNTPDVINLAHAVTSVQINLGGVGGGFHTEAVTNGVRAADFESGALVGYHGDEDIFTNFFNVMTDTPFTLTMSMDTLAEVNASSFESYSGEANADFSKTLTFATDGPVFDLPAGLTVNSVDGGIVNNVFVAPVPEPAALALLGCVLPLLFRRRSRG